MTGAPLPVREYTSAADMLRRYAEVRNTTWMERDVPAKPPAFVPQKRPEIPAPDRSVTLAAERSRRAAYLADQSGARVDKMKILQVARIVAAVSGVSVNDIKRTHGGADIAKARHIAMYLACRTGRTLVAVGWYLGGRDHSTVWSAKRRVQEIAQRLGIHRLSDAVEIAQRLWDEPWDAEVSA